MFTRLTDNVAIWTIIVVLLAIDAAWVISSGTRVVPNQHMIIAFVAMAGINLVYVTLRTHETIAVFSASVAQLIAFSSASMLLTYLVATAGFPLVDDWLAGLDRAMGLDYAAYFHWVQDHPRIDQLFWAAYNSSVFQIVFLLLVLPVLGRLERIREMVWLVIITMLFVIVFSMLMPAAGAWIHYDLAHLTDAYYVADFTALRAGTMPEIDMSRITGIVQFPSFHAQIACILVYVVREIAYLFPAFALLNLLTIAATPVFGGHHFVDVVAGLAMMPVCILIQRYCLASGSQAMNGPGAGS